MTVWTTGNSLGTARSAASGCGSSSAALVSGGTSGGTFLTSSEEMNALAWASGGSLSTARDTHAGFGSQTAGVVCGGRNTITPTVLSGTEHYNGSSWINKYGADVV